jgi:hypothetical protein
MLLLLILLLLVLLLLLFLCFLAAFCICFYRQSAARNQG